MRYRSGVVVPEGWVVMGEGLVPEGWVVMGEGVSGQQGAL